MTTKKKRQYVTLAVSPEAHKALRKKAKQERRTIIRTLDVLLGL